MVIMLRDEKQRRLFMFQILTEFFCLVFIIAGLTSLFLEKAIYAIYFLMFAPTFLPQFRRFLENKFSLKIAILFQAAVMLIGILLLVVLFSSGSALFPMETGNAMTSFSPFVP